MISAITRRLGDGSEEPKSWEVIRSEADAEEDRRGGPVIADGF
jgi:hypothetical protein